MSESAPRALEEVEREYREVAAKLGDLNIVIHIQQQAAAELVRRAIELNREAHRARSEGAAQ